MKKELQEKLYNKYPLIFGQKDLPMTQTAMCWGIDTDDGWYTLIDSLCSCIQHHIDQRKGEVPQVEATQVKEKFGGLRFYYIGGDAYVDGLITLAQALSYRTCQICGNPGRVTAGSWVYTYCQAHADENKQPLQEEDEDD